MSLATRKKILLLTMISGSLRMIAYSGLTPEHCNKAFESAEFECTWLANRLYGEVVNRKSTKRWMRSKKREWEECGESLDMASWSPAMLSTVALNYCEDLVEKEESDFIKRTIEGIRNKVRDVSYHFTGQEYNEKHFDEANQMTEEIYSVIGFRR